MKEKKSFWNEERGQFTYILLFIAIFAVLLFAFAIVAPVLEALIIGFWGQTSNTLTPIIQTQIDIVTDTNTKAAMQSALDSQSAMQTTTVELFTTLVTYAGIITIVVVFMAWLLIGRRNVEAGGLG